MINIDLVLRIGKLNKRAELDQSDWIDLSLYENVYDSLMTYNNDSCNYAELKLQINPNHNNEEILLASFKKITTRTKSGKNVYWVLA
jgi:hypothetical protein